MAATIAAMSDGAGSARYMPHLDALRAFAVAAVAYSHWVPKRFHGELPWGPAGVQLFFVLSGFLISGILIRARESATTVEESRSALRRFYIRRFLRIFPLYYTVLAALLVLRIPPVPETVWWHATYLSNIYFVLQNEWVSPLAHFWSLAVEEQFYLFWPFVLLFTPPRWYRLAIVVMIATGIVSRLVLPHLFPEARTLTALPISNFDALGLGALLALVVESQPARQRLTSLCFAGIPIFFVLHAVVLATEAPSTVYPLRHTAMLMGFVWLVDSAARGWQGPWARLLGCAPILYLGRISYGLYLLHNLVDIPLDALASLAGAPGVKTGFVGLLMRTGLTIGGAALSWHFLEAPLNRLKERFPYSRTRPVT